MTVIDVVMISSALVFCVIASISDIKTSIVSNKLVFGFLALGIVLSSISVFIDSEFLEISVTNIICMTICSVCMYLLDMWAAGDSKFLISILALIPGRILYEYKYLGSMPTIIIVVIAFSLSFIFVVVESFSISIRKKERPRFHDIKDKIKSFARYYVCGSIYMLAFNMLLGMLFWQFLEGNITLLLVTNLLFATLIFKINFLFSNKAIVIGIVVFLVLLIFQISNNSTFIFSFKSFLLALSLIMLGQFSEKDNYETVDTNEVKAGMILSSVTVLAMQNSSIKGLPTGISEDMNCRLTDEEAKSVRKWKDSAKGKPTVTIVRKLPFIMFISLGTLFFLLGGIIWIYS